MITRLPQHMPEIRSVEELRLMLHKAMAEPLYAFDFEVVGTRSLFNICDARISLRDLLSDIARLQALEKGGR